METHFSHFPHFLFCDEPEEKQCALINAKNHKIMLHSIFSYFMGLNIFYIALWLVGLSEK